MLPKALPDSLWSFQMAFTASRGPLPLPEGPYRFQRALTASRGPLPLPEGPCRFQRAFTASRGPLPLPEGRFQMTFTASVPWGFKGFLSFRFIFYGSHTFYVIFFAFLLIFHRFRDSQDVLGVLEGPRRALKVLGSSPGRFWDVLGRPGRVPGRRPIMTFRK